MILFQTGKAVYAMLSPCIRCISEIRAARGTTQDEKDTLSDE